MTTSSFLEEIYEGWVNIKSQEITLDWNILLENLKIY